MGSYPHPQELQPELPIAPHLLPPWPAPWPCRGTSPSSVAAPRWSSARTQGPWPWARRPWWLGVPGRSSAAGPDREKKWTKNGGQIKRICGLSWTQISFLVMLVVNNYSTILVCWNFNAGVQQIVGKKVEVTIVGPNHCIHPPKWGFQKQNVLVSQWIPRHHPKVSSKMQRNTSRSIG